MIKAVAFDFGGVIEIGAGRGYMDSAAEILGVSVEEFKTAYFKNNHLSNVENIPWQEMFIQVVAEFDNSKETEEKVRSALQILLAQNRLNKELVEMFSSLRAKGLKVGILSNATSELQEKLRNYQILDLVDAVVVSGDIGFQKPHKEAFQILFDRLQVHSHETVFVDDSPKSLEKAEEIGYAPVLFKNNDQLRAELEGLGISL